MNALKHGKYSKQFARIGALLAQDPAIRQALLDLADRHNLRQQKANEIAAFLFTRIIQRAENASGGRLKLDAPADDLEAIKQAGQLAALRQVQNEVRRAAKNSQTARRNQTPDTTIKRQSDP
jgi:hypothetical protein